MHTIFTIGHSTHSLSRFVELLKQHDITALGDVRSKPYSRMNPQFNREDLKQALKEAGIAYVFLGKELGARSEDPSCYENGKIQYERLALTEQFRLGVERVKEGAAKFRLALMCAEKDPLECHRTVLVARRLAELGMDVQHIHADGRLESQPELNERLMRELALPESDLFRSHEDILKDAYDIQAERIAYAVPGAPHGVPAGGATG
jgi:uncharacterized protein (DUF488 family)